MLCLCLTRPTALPPREAVSIAALETVISFWGGEEVEERRCEECGNLADGHIDLSVMEEAIGGILVDEGSAVRLLETPSEDLYAVEDSVNVIFSLFSSVSTTTFENPANVRENARSNRRSLHCGLLSSSRRSFQLLRSSRLPYGTSRPLSRYVGLSRSLKRSRSHAGLRGGLGERSRHTGDLLLDRVDLGGPRDEDDDDRGSASVFGRLWTILRRCRIS